jgi:hypothetical protein
MFNYGAYRGQRVNRFDLICIRPSRLAIRNFPSLIILPIARSRAPSSSCIFVRLRVSPRTSREHRYDILGVVVAG